MSCIDLLVPADAGLQVDRHRDLAGYVAVAVFDVDGQYRYLLARQWNDGPAALFVMLNPSTATAVDDDQTIRRCVGFARRERCGAVLVVNLFGLRATDPRELSLHPAPVGPHNDVVLRTTAATLATTTPAGPIIAAWGAGGRLQQRDRAVSQLLVDAGAVLHCLGITADGYPRHPSRLSNAIPLQPYTAMTAVNRGDG